MVSRHRATIWNRPDKSSYLGDTYSLETEEPGQENKKKEDAAGAMTKHLFRMKTRCETNDFYLYFVMVIGPSGVVRLYQVTRWVRNDGIEYCILYSGPDKESPKLE